MQLGCFGLRFQRPSQVTPDCDVMSVIYDRDPCGLEVRPPEDGLEVWAPDVGGLQVSTRVQVEQALEAFRGCDDLEAVNPSSSGIARVNTESFIEEIEQKQSPPNKKPWLILVLAGVALLFVIVAAVLGVVVGLRLNNNSNNNNDNNKTTPAESPQASSTTTPPISPSKPANAVHAGSGIGITGWWTGPSSFTIRLVYQGQDGYLRLMRYHSGDGKWSTLAIFSDARAKLGTPIAASCYNIPYYCFSPITSSDVSPCFLFPQFCTKLPLTRGGAPRFNLTLLELHTGRNLLSQRPKHDPGVVLPRTRLSLAVSTNLFRQRTHVPQWVEGSGEHAHRGILAQRDIPRRTQPDAGSVRCQPDLGAELRGSPMLKRIVLCRSALFGERGEVRRRQDSLSAG